MNRRSLRARMGNGDRTGGARGARGRRCGVADAADALPGPAQQTEECEAAPAWVDSQGPGNSGAPQKGNHFGFGGGRGLGMRRRNGSCRKTPGSGGQGEGAA